MGRSATDEEVANELGISASEYHQRIQDMAGSAILSLEDVWGNPEEGEAPTRMAEVRDEKAVDPLDEAEWSSKRDALAAAITRYPSANDWLSPLLFRRAYGERDSVRPQSIPFKSVAAAYKGSHAAPGFFGEVISVLAAG